MSIATRLISAGIVETLADITSETRIKKLEQRNLTIALDAGTIKHK
jgi:hypothetical protein